MEPIRLLPCPFCEGPPCVIVQNEAPNLGQATLLQDYGDDGKLVIAFVFCHECGASCEEEDCDIYTASDYADAERRACERWNRRDARHRSMYDGGAADGLNLYPRPNARIQRRAQRVRWNE